MVYYQTMKLIDAWNGSRQDQATREAARALGIIGGASENLIPEDVSLRAMQTIFSH